MTVEFIHGHCPRPEFGTMFGGWLTQHQGQNFLVDCGVGAGAEDLVERLKRSLGGKPLDYVLLTHIHLDHAGGLGEIFKAWPNAKAVVHQKGLKHLVDPEKLWVGTVEVMGEEIAQIYGRLQPIAENRLIPHTEVDIDGLTVYQTPGHAPHHLSFCLGEKVFIGEAAGAPMLIDGRLYCRPATPPRYFPEVSHESIRSLTKLPDGPAYCGHNHEPLPLHETLKRSLAQLELWDEVLRRPKVGWEAGVDPLAQLERLIDLLLVEDPELALVKSMNASDRWREAYFLGNSIRGFLGYYAEMANNSQARERE